MTNRWTSIRLYALIEAMHAAPEWACFEEVANGTGSAARRRADAVAMNLWPSRGLTVRGFEIKVTRADFKNESKEPEKAETIAAFCDEWWLVTPPKLLDIAEVPPAWGLMEPDETGKRLHTIRAATPTEAKPLTRTFVAAVCRAAHKMVETKRKGWVPIEEIDERIQREYKRGLADSGMRLTQLENDRDGAHKNIADFRDATGIDISNDSWNTRVKDIAEAYKIGRVFRDKYYNVYEDALKQLQTTINLLSNCSANLETFLKEEGKDD